MDNNPRISIITVVYNGEKFLEKTIQSVINQTYKHIEYIIIDGGSKDGTTDIIKKYEEYVDYWVSEKDEGIYDAMNKGLRVATGEWVNFMNAGDRFYDLDVLVKMVAQMRDRQKAYFGRAEIYSKEASWYHPAKNIDQKDIGKWLNAEQPNHQAIFFPKYFYTQELYDLRYKIFGDSDYKYKVYQKCGFVFVDEIICRFEMGGISSGFYSYKDVVSMMKEAWMGRGHRGNIHFIKRVFVYNIKYILRYLSNDKVFNLVLKKYRKGS